MPSMFLEGKPREFTPMALPQLTNEVREAVNAALKAMSAWRNEMADTNERNGKRVIDKMSEAATMLGWPEQIVDAASTQMQHLARMQITAMDHLMDTWEEQLKLPNPKTASSSTMLSKLKSTPGLDITGNWPGADAFQNPAMNPFQLWMQLGEQWQKSWADVLSAWSATTKPH
jgi:hypothetical protein